MIYRLKTPKAVRQEIDRLPGNVRQCIKRTIAGLAGDDSLCFDFPAALGDRFPAADPSPHEWQFEYTPKVKLQIKRDKSGGGCG